MLFVQGKDGKFELKKWSAWEKFRIFVTEVITTGTFQGVPLLLNNNDTRISRSQHNDEMPDFTAVKVRCFRYFSVFLQEVIRWMEHYFDWNDDNLKWLDLTENVFMFTGTRDEANPAADRMAFRISELQELFTLPHSHTPLANDQKNILICQYRTLFLRASEIAEELKLRSDYSNYSWQYTNNTIWYKICTNEDSYRGLSEIIDFAFRFLLRDANECTVESLIGDVDFVKGTRRTRIQ